MEKFGEFDKDGRTIEIFIDYPKEFAVIAPWYEAICEKFMKTKPSKNFSNLKILFSMSEKDIEVFEKGVAPKRTHLGSVHPEDTDDKITINEMSHLTRYLKAPDIVARIFDIAQPFVIEDVVSTLIHESAHLLQKKESRMNKVAEKHLKKIQQNYARLHGCRYRHIDVLIANRIRLMYAYQMFLSEGFAYYYEFVHSQSADFSEENQNKINEKATEAAEVVKIFMNKAMEHLDDTTLLISKADSHEKAAQIDELFDKAAIPIKDIGVHMVYTILAANKRMTEHDIAEMMPIPFIKAYEKAAKKKKIDPLVTYRSQKGVIDYRSSMRELAGHRRSIEGRKARIPIAAQFKEHIGFHPEDEIAQVNDPYMKSILETIYKILLEPSKATRQVRVERRLDMDNLTAECRQLIHEFNFYLSQLDGRLRNRNRDRTSYGQSSKQHNFPYLKAKLENAQKALVEPLANVLFTTISVAYGESHKHVFPSLNETEIIREYELACKQLGIDKPVIALSNRNADFDFEFIFDYWLGYAKAVSGQLALKAA